MNDNAKNSPVGLISVGVPWFDVGAAQRNLDETRAWLGAKWPVVGPAQVVVDAQSLERALEELLAGPRPEVLVLQIGTFPDGEAPLAIAERLRVPVILHSLPEPDIEKEVALNSLCGANLSTFTLTEMGFPHKAIHGPVSDPGVQAEMSAYIQAGLALARVRRLRLGLVGFRAPGFYPCVFDELLIRRIFGLGLDHISLGEVVLALQNGRRRSAPATAFPAIGGGSLSAEAVEWIERYYAALSSVLEESGKRLFAIKDWPEIMGLNDPGGLWPALGWLQQEGYLIAPEGDVNAALTMAVLNGLTGEVPFFADISAWDDQSSSVALWHYGGAPCLARNPDEIRYGKEGREVQFTLKPGRATLARVGLHHGAFRILAVGVEVLDRTVQLRRAGGWARTVHHSASEVVYAMLDDGWEHHMVLVYGDAVPALRAVARFTGLSLTCL